MGPFFKDLPNEIAVFEHPRWPQDGLNMAQDGPKMGPRWRKMAPRWPQDGPRWAQEPKMATSLAIRTLAQPRLAPVLPFLTDFPSKITIFSLEDKPVLAWEREARLR